MENEDAKIIALALGIPSATFVSLAILIAVSFHYNLVERVRRQRRHPTLAITPTNDVDAIPLEQLPPRIHAPVPRHSISVDDLLANNGQHEEEVVDESPHPENPEGGSPTPTRRRTPVIPNPTTETPRYTPYVPRTPSPGTYARFAARVGGFEVGRDIRPVAPATNYDTWAGRDRTPPPAAGVASEEFWDNVDIPYSAYFPAPRANSPAHRTPPPAGYAYEWDQPARQQALEPIRIEAPIASTSAHIYPAPRSGWRNVRSPARSPHRPPRASRWQQLADRIISEQQHEEPEPTRNTDGDWPTESTSDTSTAVNPPRPATPFRPVADHVADSTPEST